MSIVLFLMLWDIEALPENSLESVKADFSVYINVPDFSYFLSWLSDSDLLMKGSLFWD